MFDPEVPSQATQPSRVVVIGAGVVGLAAYRRGISKSVRLEREMALAGREAGVLR